LFIRIRGGRYYLWRAVDQDGDTLDILVQKRRNIGAATRFFRKLLKGLRYVPNRLVTDNLRSYSAAHRIILPTVHHCTNQYANNRAEGPINPLGNGSGICAGLRLYHTSNSFFWFTARQQTLSDRPPLDESRSLCRVSKPGLYDLARRDNRSGDGVRRGSIRPRTT
jgi:transposase-like protein